MLRFGLILLLAASAFSAPRYDEYVTIDTTEDLGVIQDNGSANHIIDALNTIIDNGELSVYGLTDNAVLTDLATSQNPGLQALAIANAFATVLPLSTGNSGDACIEQNLINAYLSGNHRQALRNYINHLAANLGSLVRLVKDPQAARFSVGPRSSCPAGGRVYNFKAAWDIIIESNPANSLIEEHYCTARRLYNAFDAKLNNIAAGLTANSLPPVAAVFRKTLGPVRNFVEALSGKGDLNKALIIAQNALVNSV